MVDVLMIMLVFFMVTSTYLDLDMVPLAGGDGPAEGTATATTGGGEGRHLLVRIDADGRAHLRGRTRSAEELGAVVSEERARNPTLEVIILPSGAADVQALASTMDALVAAGATRLRVVRLEGQP